MSRAAPLIAVVDDEASICRALARLLRSAYYRAETFRSGDEFLASLHKDVPNCLVLDLHMPAMTGVQLQEELRRLGKNLPVIVITAHDEPGARDRCLALGASYYLRKPVQCDTLLSSIRSLVGAQADERGPPTDPSSPE
jgi:FixJ family two-component response regulator